MPISKQEVFDMLAVYFECIQNATFAARVYALRLPLRRRYQRRVFIRLAEQLRINGVAYPRNQRRGRGRTEDNIINVLAYVELNPHIMGTRVIAQDLGVGVAKTTVLRILKDNRLHSYHICLHRELTLQDYDHRLNYCYWLQAMIAEDPRFLSRILWSDESTFRSDGHVNRHNMHYWSETNPRWMREVQLQGRWSINVWCGILGGSIIGPYIFDQTVNGDNYLTFLTNILPILLEDVPLETRRYMFFQHDGCPAHFSANVRQFLDRTFPDRWIGRGSLFPWPARSPDLTCLDFYLWGTLKDLVYATRPTTRDNMVNRIRNAIQSISIAEVEAAVQLTRENF